MRIYLNVVLIIALAAAFGACRKKGEEEPPGTAPAGEPGTGGAPGEVSEPAPATATVTAGPLNMREDPGLEGAVVGRLSEGEKVRVLGRSDGAETIDGKSAYWYEVETIDEKRGWVFGGYLDLDGEEAPGTAEAAGTAGGAAEAPLTPISVTAVADVPGWAAGDYYARGKELAQAGEYGEAVFYYKAAAEKSPQTGTYWFDLGLALQELGRHGEAATAYERAVTLKPDDFWAHNNLGLACLRSQRPRRAVEVLEKALTLEPRGVADAEGARNVARRNLVAAYELNGQPEKAAALR
jgi:tetratricopeptide (TPR) repeat protein